MKNVFLLFAITMFCSKLTSQEKINIPTKFPTDYGIFTFPLGSRITIELKENGDKYEYRVLNIEPYKEYYSFNKEKNIYPKI